MREKDDLDLLLDSALATYADPGPESGLEDRVLATLSAARSSGERRRLFGSPRRRWLPWAIAVPVVTCLLALWLSIGRTVHAPTTQLAVQRERSTKPSLGAQESSRPSAVAMRPSGAKVPSRTSALAARLKSCPVTKPEARGALSRLADTKHDDGGASSRMVEPCPGVAESIARGARLPKLDVFPTPQPLTPQEQALALVATQTPLPVRKALAQAQSQKDAPVHIAAIHIPPLEPSDQDQH